MARPPRFIHPVRAVRAALRDKHGKNLTQAMLAKRLGISTSYLKAVENGQRKPNSTLYAKLALLSGVDHESLKGQRTKPRDAQTGTVLSEKTVADWNSFRSSDFATAINIHALKDAEICLISLGQAAFETKKIDALILAFEEWLVSAIKDFGLEAQFMRIKRERSQKWNSRMKQTGEALFVNTNPTTRVTMSAAAVFLQADKKIEAAKLTPAALATAFARGTID